MVFDRWFRVSLGSVPCNLGCVVYSSKRPFINRLTRKHYNNILRLMYAKIFASLYQGTLRGCSDEILVFTNMLAHADLNGIVDKHWRAIAEETGLPRERVEAAIKNLEAADPESRSPEQDGRRIILLDAHRAWGWQIVNHGKYRAIRSEEDRREQNRISQEKWRNKHNNKQSKPSVSSDKPSKPIQIQYTDTEAIKPTVATLPEWLSVEIWDSFKKYRGSKFTALAQKIIIKKLTEFKEQGQDPNRLLENSIANGWTSVVPEKTLNGHKTSWWLSDAGIMAEGRRLGIDARPGESSNSYKARLEAAQ